MWIFPMTDHRSCLLWPSLGTASSPSRLITLGSACTEQDRFLSIAPPSPGADRSRLGCELAIRSCVPRG